MNSKLTGEGAAADDDGDDVKKKCLERQTKAGNQEHFLTLSLSHSLIHS